MLLCSIAAAVTLATNAPTQAARNLAEYLSAHPWNVAENGPMLVLEPARAKADGPGTSIAAFDRKKVPLAGMTAVVPRTMIAIDDSFRETPNLYDGLPASDKVLYLLRSLSQEQWQKAAGGGIGMPDLVGEQRLVMASLLPKPFVWTSYRLMQDGIGGADSEKATLNDEDRLAVRLKVEREVSMDVHLKEGNGISVFGTDRYRGEPGDVRFERDKEQDFVQHSSFGIGIRKEVPNLLKPSHLDYRNGVLSRTISLQPQTTVGEIVRSINSACGLEIIPDFRVADRAVNFYGGQATARDLLQALALSVEGTYRQVGRAYALTSDLTGMGTRKYRIASWEQGIRAETEKRSQVWRQEIGGRAGFAAVRFDNWGSLAPNRAVADLIEKGDQGQVSRDIGTEMLTPALRHFLDQWDREYKQQPIRKDKVGLSSGYYYSFVLPSGTVLAPEGGIGTALSFRPRQDAQIQAPRFGSRVPDPPYATPKNYTLTLLEFAESATDAVAIVQAAAALPGCRLWLDTHSPEALGAAVKAGKQAGIEVGLALRPWRTATSEPDTNLAGEFGQQVINRVAALMPAWYTPADFTTRVGTWIAPTSSQVGEAWDRWRSLARTPGLCGVMLLETQPFGYEPDRARWQSIVGPLQWASLSHGYTVRQRLAFLRQEAVDPIDIGDDGYWTTPDLRQTYFFDDGLRGMPSIYDGTDDTHPKTREVGKLWRSFLAKLNKDAIEGLVSDLSTAPVFVEPRLKNINSSGGQSAAIYNWTPGAPLPEFEEQHSGEAVARKAGYVLLTMTENPLAPEAALTRRRIYYTLGGISPTSNVVPVFDFEHVAPAKFGAALAKWFNRETAKEPAP